MTQDQQTYGRAVSAALLGLGVQTGGALLLFLVAFASGQPAAWVAGVCACGGLIPWLALLILYQQHRLERLEALETESLRRAGGESALFAQGAEELAVARRRLTQFYRWGIPLASVLTLLFQAAAAAWFLYRYSHAAGPGLEPVSRMDPLLAAALAFATAFFSFIVSRYVAGMAQAREWELLRGGAGHLMANVLLALALAAGFALSYAEWPGLLRFLPLAVPAFQGVLGAEVFLALVLNVYLPRRPGEYPRPAFDSRLLGFLSRPEGLAQALQETLNYQFGFEVTRSWFWRLLTKACLPLLGLGVGALLLLSSFVVVGPQQQALVFRFGRLVTEEPLGPGSHLKWPWPLERATLYETGRIQEFQAGSPGAVNKDAPLLWTNQHTEGAERLWLTMPTALAAEAGLPGRPGRAVSLVVVDVPVQYRIRDVMEYVRSDGDPAKHLRALAEDELSRYLLSRDVDELMGPRRGEAGPELRRRIQSAADRAGLGLEVLFVGLAGIHPPQDAAESFLETVQALLEKETSLELARQEAIKTLAEAVGSAAAAQQLVREIAKLEELRAAGGPEARGAEDLVDQLLQRAGGQAAQALAGARASRWTLENGASAEADRFAKERLAYAAAPWVYRMRRYLEALQAGLAGRRKVLIAADRSKLTVRLDLKETSADIPKIDLTRKP